MSSWQMTPQSHVQPVTEKIVDEIQGLGSSAGCPNRFVGRGLPADLLDFFHGPGKTVS